jgi:ParB-like chromosome segregation protein Spo0J
MTIDKYNDLPGVLENLPTDIIDTSWSVLRSVNKDTLKYQNFKQSIAKEGIEQNLLVRRITDEETGEVRLSLIDGLHRLTAAIELGIPTVPCKILDECSNLRALSLQAQLNLHSIRTPAATFGRMILRIIAEDETNTLTVAGLADLLNVDVGYIKRRVRVAKMNNLVQDAVDTGEVSIGKAIEISKLPRLEQQEWIEIAKELKFDEFRLAVRDRLRSVKGSKIKTVTGEEFVPTPKLRTVTAIANMIDERSYDVSDELEAEEAFYEGLRFCIQMDEATYARRIEQHQQKLLARENRRKERQTTQLENKIKELERQIEAVNVMENSE